MSVLQEIIKNKKEDLAVLKSSVPLSDLKERVKDCGQTRPFGCALKREADDTIRLIAELKKASPSEGVIREDFNLQEILKIYAHKAVYAISVLTEERYFMGSLGNLTGARKATKKPLLRKDFIVDDYQLYESRVYGADAVLLICAALDKYHLADILGLSAELSLECLVEVHNFRELDAALSSGAGIIGINNRDLNTLRTSLNVTFDLVNDIPAGKVVVSESGIHTSEDVKEIASRGIDAILVGTTLMKADDIGKKIDELVG